MAYESKAEREAAADIARFLRERVADLPTESELRALALRSSGRWARIARVRELFAVVGGGA